MNSAQLAEAQQQLAAALAELDHVKKSMASEADIAVMREEMSSALDAQEAAQSRAQALELQLRSAQADAAARLAEAQLAAVAAAERAAEADARADALAKQAAAAATAAESERQRPPVVYVPSRVVLLASDRHEVQPPSAAPVSTPPPVSANGAKKAAVGADATRRAPAVRSETPSLPALIDMKKSQLLAEARTRGLVLADNPSVSELRYALRRARMKKG